MYSVLEIGYIHYNERSFIFTFKEGWMNGLQVAHLVTFEIQS